VSTDRVTPVAAIAPIPNRLKSHIRRTAGRKWVDSSDEATCRGAAGQLGCGGDGGDDVSDDAGAGGGGASDVRQGGTTLGNRAVVAGGGGLFGGGGGGGDNAAGEEDGGAGGGGGSGLARPGSPSRPASARATAS
jgi:hypothetical protein